MKQYKCKTVWISVTINQCCGSGINVTIIQCCGSGMSIPDPNFYPSRIQQKHKSGKGKFFCPTIFCSNKYFKIANILFFNG
jgi:hypothetical protein